MLQTTAPALRTEDIAPASLVQQKIKALVLDYDGVLAPHRAACVLPQIKLWINACSALLGVDNVFILSNRPSPSRIDYFSREFPGIRVITGIRKKPFPDGLQQILQLTGYQPSAVMLLDDRLLTGVLSAGLAGTRITYITAPYIRFDQSPVREAYFMVLRRLEKMLVRPFATSLHTG